MEQMTTPASAEPTEDDWLIASELYGCKTDTYPGDDFVTCVVHDYPWPCEEAGITARALASQRAEIVARYEAVADRLDGQARILRKMALTAEDDEGAELAHAAAAIREAAPK